MFIMSISVMEIRMVFLLLFFNSILSSLFCTMNINYFKIKPKNPIKITKQRLFLHARLYVFPHPHQLHLHYKISSKW